MFCCLLLAGTVLGQDTGAIKAAPSHSNNGWSWTFTIWTNGRFWLDFKDFGENDTGRGEKFRRGLYSPLVLD